MLQNTVCNHQTSRICIELDIIDINISTSYDTNMSSKNVHLQEAYMSLTTRVHLNWKDLKVAIKNNWGKLKDEELDHINGNTGKLIDLIMKKYDVTKKKAEDSIEKFLRRTKATSQ